MVTARPARSTLGCLFLVLVLGAVGYAGAAFAQPYLRFYRFRDAMRQEARFSRTRSDADIQRRLLAVADSIGLPHEAGQVTVQRRAGAILISSEYDERVDLPLVGRDIHLSAAVEGAL